MKICRIKDATKQKPARNTNKNTTKSASYWKHQNVAYLIDQLETHYGVRLTIQQKKGPNRLKRPELADMIIEKLNI